jgi:hypothetical protein
MAEIGDTNTHEVLVDLVNRITCKPGWRFVIADECVAGFRLVIYVPGLNSFHPDQRLAVNHVFPVPHATYNANTWRRWVFECCRGVENHELGEWFKVDNHRPFAPMHGPGENPYTVHEIRPDSDARTLQDGSRFEGEL